jgi:hypothetical protein
MNWNRKSMILFGVLLPLITGTVRADLQGRWQLDDGTGTIALDSSGNDRHAEMVGTPTWAEGYFDGALQTSLGNYLVVPAYTGILGADPRTCTAWIKTEQANAVIFGWGLISNGTKWIVRVNQGGQLRCEVDGGYQYANTSLVDNEWHHVAAVLTAEAPNVQGVLLYVDGVHDGTNADVSPRAINTLEDMDVTLGQNPHSLATRWFDGLLDDMRIYSRVLTVEDIQAVMIGKGPGVAAELAGLPGPDDEAVDVLRDVELSWSVGEFAATHTVYLSAVFDDVNTANEAALVSQGQEETSYNTGLLEFGQTYFWRVDEVNAAPDFTVFKGNLWRFTVEPMGIPIETITATASGFNPGMKPSKTIDGSGLNALDQHSTLGTEMWLTATADSWIQYEFDRDYKLHDLQVWNSNQVVEAFIGFGVKKVLIETSLDGETWTAVDGVPPFARATGQATYEANTAVDLSGIVAKYVKITPQNAHGFTGQSGLSEVRFSYIPNTAREITPAHDSTTDDIEVTLSWRAGREAATHEVYLGTEAADLALAGTTDEPVFVAEGLEYAQTYTWQVVEVNEAELPSTYTSDMQRFNTPSFGTVDDFESYSGEQGEEVFMTWFDGYGGDTSLGGATTGHIDGPFVETINVYDGSQSMPVYVDNDGGFFDIDGNVSSPAFSEVVRDLDSQDWTTNGVLTLSIMFAGSPGLTGQLYCKINGAKLTYDGDPANIGVSTWQAWNIDLATVGSDLQNIQELTIGVEGGTSGILFIDAIRLYPQAGDVITPKMPDTANLLAYYPLDGDYQDASGNNRHGVPVADIGNFFIDGVSGQGLDLSSGNGYVEITGFKGIMAIDGVQQAFSISNWFTITETSGDHEMVTWGASPGSEHLAWRVQEGRLRTEHGSGNLRGNTYVNDGEWHQAALTVAEGANLRPDVTKLYVDGVEDTILSGTGSDTAYNLQPDADVCIGCRADTKTRFWPGALDEVRIYDRVLTSAEVAGLAGKTKPVHQPF